MALASQTIDDEIAADWAAIREKHSVEPEEAETTPEAAPEPIATEPEKADRARDEAGRFAKEPKEAKDESKPAERTGSGDAAKPASRNAQGTAAASERNAGASAEPAAQPDSAQQGQERDVSRPPSTWKPTARAEWEKLPPTVRAEIHRREADFMNGQGQLLPDAKFGSSMRATIEPYRMLIEAEGGTPERAVADLMRMAAVLRVGTPQQKYDLVVQTAKQFGVDLSPLQQKPADGQPAPAPPQSFQDPRVDQILQHLAQQNQHSAQVQQSELESTVTRWMGEMDAQGKPLRPYVGDVMTEMMGLVPNLRQANPGLSHSDVLQQAYERATWGNPEIRSLLQRELQQTTDQQRASENQNRVREARRAASVNVPRRASIPNPGKPGSLEDTIAATARELGLIT